MVQNQVINDGLGIDEMINVLVNKTWKAPRLKGLEGLILQQNEQLLLTYLMGAALNPDVSFATHAAVIEGIEEIKNYATKQLPSASGATKGYLLLTLDRIKNRKDEKPFIPEPIPPGSPIGCYMD